LKEEESSIRMFSSYYRYRGRNDTALAITTLPLYIASIARYGLRILILLAICLILGYMLELLTARIRDKRAKQFGFPAWILLPLILPPMLPLWMGGVALFFGTLIAVVFFGGHGRELASSVAVGWAFGSLSFPVAFGFGWTYPFPQASLGFTRLSAALPTIDHPVLLYSTRLPVSMESIISGRFPGPPGSAIPLITIACGILLLIFKAVDIKSSLSFFLPLFLLQLILHLLAPARIQAVESLLIGNILIAGFFIVPDFSLVPRTDSGRWITGIVTGIIAFLIRNFSSFPDGVFFAVLFGNTFSAIIDEWVVQYRFRSSKS
jgi:Na+-translocating ferredoxin:NAD+ oxidoreductase RnfD subunit